MSATRLTRADRLSPHPLTVLGWIAATAIALSGLSACGSDGPGVSEGGGHRHAAGVGEPGGLLAWMASHPEDAGLVVLPEKGAARLSFNADRRFPLASTRKVLILGALTQAGGSLATKIPRSAVEHFYAPGTDGGAHRKAGLDAPRLTLKAIARATVEESDNAAADTLLARVSPDAVDAYARQQGMARQDPIYPLLGEYAAWTREPRWASLSPAERARRAEELARRVPAGKVKVPGIEDQRRLAASSVAGTPAEWAALMRNIARTGGPRLVELLDWPRRKDPKVCRTYTRLLAKGGSLAGVITEADYIQSRGRAGVAVALFLRDLPLDVESTLLRTFSQQKLLLRLASDPAFRKKAEAVLTK